MFAVSVFKSCFVLFFVFLSVSHLTLVLARNINFSFVTTILGLVSVRRVWPTVNSSVECYCESQRLQVYTVYNQYKLKQRRGNIHMCLRKKTTTNKQKSWFAN